MLAGLDIGGTHTDAVIVDNDQVVAQTKIETDHSDLAGTITNALSEVLTRVDMYKIERICLSTTLATNAIVQDNVELVGVIVSAGPGIDPYNFSIGDNYFVLNGSVDHRGEVVQPPDCEKLAEICNTCGKKKIKVFSVVSKFSVRNPVHERQIGELLGGAADFISMGHLLSGKFSLPRRIVTAYYNSAIWRLNNEFIDAIEATLRSFQLKCDCVILKADGGTMPLGYARNNPVKAIHSGPSASVMGIVALCNIKEDSIILDIGGTTTDIAVFASGSPLVENDGISINKRPSLVRALMTRSIAIGGDSVITDQNGSPAVGPQRLGNAMAFGGKQPTLLDAFNIEKMNIGDHEKSYRGLLSFTRKTGKPVREYAEKVIENALGQIVTAVNEMLQDINEKPVYTIHEMIVPDRISPEKVYLMGGPASVIREYLERYIRIPVTVPENYSVANAVGAALAKTTFSIELLADSGRGTCVIPQIDVCKEIGCDYSLQDAESDAKQYLETYLKNKGFSVSAGDIVITDSRAFNMIEGFWSAGKELRVKCQIKPGVEFVLRQRTET